MARFVGGTGIDVYVGGIDADQISGNDGNDRLFGGLGEDAISGGAGNDLLSSNGIVDGFTATVDNADTETDAVNGGDGNDVVAGGWNDRLYGGTGNDVLYLDLRGVDHGVTLDLGRLATGGTVRIGTGLISGFEGYASIALTAFDDDIRLGGLKTYAVLGGGIYAGDGNDRIVMGAFGSIGSVQFGSTSLNGGNGNDTIIGSVGSDDLRGDAGNDRLVAGNGNDVIYGGDGNDLIDVRGLGNDLVVGGDGIDSAVLSGVRADWTVTLDFRDDGMRIALYREQLQPNGAPGRTVQAKEIESFRFDDGLFTARSVLSGYVIGTSENDTLIPGQAGSYGLSTTDGNDTLYGLGGDDVLDGGLGADTYCGGDGSDSFHLRQRGDRILDLGNDDVILSWIDYVRPQNTYATARIVLMGTRDIDATDDFARAITGNAGDNHLIGGGLLDGGAGDDILENSGDATVTYASAISGVTVRLATAGAQDTGGAGIDTLIGVARLIGSDHADVLVGGDGSDMIVGGAGDDRLSGGDTPNDIGRDVLSYAQAAQGVTVSLAVSGAQDTIGAGIDTLAGFEMVIGSAFADRLSGSTLADTLEGGMGDDQIFGGAGADTIDGGDGADIINGGAGRDAVRGGGGGDRFVFDRSLVQGNVPGELETIGDYRQAEGDIVDLAALDANFTVAGDQAFVRVAAFTGSAGELVVRQVQGNYWTTVRGDIDGDGGADFQILVYGYGTSPETISFVL